MYYWDNIKIYILLWFKTIQCGFTLVLINNNVLCCQLQNQDVFIESKKKLDIFFLHLKMPYKGVFILDR